jgi:ubiquitin C-terminal hydrolase
LLFRYYLALLSASIIGLSHCDGADTHEKLIASVLQGFVCNPILGHLHGYSAALATHAVSIIQSLSVHNDLLLQSFSQIPVPQRHSLIRLLLCSASCPNLLQPNASSLPSVICLFLQDFLRTLTLSFHQSSILLGFVDFVSQDSSMLCPAVNFNWMTLFFKVFFMARDECTSLDSLFQASLCILSCIRKYMSFAKCNKNVYAFKLPSLFLLQSVILRLMTPMDFAMHPLAHEVSEHFRIIFEVASFPEDVTLTGASDDTKSNVLSPRPVTLVLKRPLCATEDSVCVELSVMIQEAINRLPSLCNSIFETLLRNSESMLLVQKKSYQSSASLERKFVGIINLGCTCYFNSITQQLFMLPGFAASVIAARVKADAPEDLETARQLTADVSTTAQSKSNTAACGILDNFRDIMIYLRHGSGNIYPKLFCDCFRFPDGSCILPDVQQDALEYFHILCDHLDNALKGGHDEKLLSRFFGGRSATQLICKGCPHRYERFEHFFTLQLAVFSNRANSVLGALQEFVAGELLEGDNQYFCSQCNKKVDTVKRTVLADLPDSIILGLKRFDFNYDTMQRIKLNVEVPFSQDLDMSPFCRENLGETPEDSEPATKRDPGYYQYALAGIVIHSGMADSGHYFSIIRDSEQTGLWHKFNDDTVTQLYDFDPKTFFGGQSSGKSVHANAYILVYNRKVPMFNHQYGQIASIENSVQLVKHTEKLSTHTMLVDSLKNRHLWQCFASSMHQLFLSSEDDRMETAYVDLLLKLNVCSALDTTETAAAFFLPLQASLSNPRKCYAILERFFARFEDAGTIDTELLQPFLDANSKRFPELPSFFTNAMKDIVSNAGACDISLFTADELLAYRNVIYGILKFYGNLSFRLYRFFPAENPADIEPITAQVAYAVQRCLHEALFRQGLENIALRYFFFKSQLSGENVDSNENFLLLRTCLTSAVFSHLSEEAPKLRSKRRAHLKSFVFESRFLACLNCLKLLSIFFLDQDHVPVQQLLANGAWDPCFSALFAREFFVSFLYCGPSPQPVHKNIMVFFYHMMTRLLPQVT